MAAGDEALRKSIGKVAIEWLLGRRPPDPAPGTLPVAISDPARPAAEGGEVRITWIGHASVLVQLPGLNLLTDPVWSERCSPVGFMGPRRFVVAPLAMEALPPIHAVLLSHDHYDHLDRDTVRRLHERFGDELTWYTPLGYADWFAGVGVTRVVERDWWEAADLPGARFQAVCVPARHWTRRRPGGTNRRLWGGWVVRPAEGVKRAEATAGRSEDGEEAPAGPRIYFAGDSGYCPAFSEIGARLGPFDASLLPVGAYEPRWFMAAAHMNPEEAVQAYAEAGGEGAFVPIHWGTWRLTFEDPLEPPERTRGAWRSAGLPAEDLHVLRHGETLRLRKPDWQPSSHAADIVSRAQSAEGAS
jgi:N-acyl-phosphatidylethanolamine-hydrolysing phospholipase D